MYQQDGDYIKDIEVNDLRNRYTLTKGSTQKMVNILNSLCRTLIAQLCTSTYLLKPSNNYDDHGFVGYTLETGTRAYTQRAHSGHHPRSR